ncbi:MAG: GntR family transcriptional regulator [Peptococcaceae bacterium]
MEKLEKVETYKDKAYKAIKASIINQDFQPGTQLNERELAERLGISRTPIREALKKLENDGWVKTEPWLGTFVMDILENDIEEIFQIRTALDPLIMELLIKKADTNDILKIEKFLGEQHIIIQKSKKVSIENFDDFHLFLAGLTGNKKLIQIMENIADMKIRLDIETLKSQKRREEVILEHQQLLYSLKEKDIPKAKQMASEHVVKARDKLLKNWAHGVGEHNTHK